jgi:hypothetical protein
VARQGHRVWLTRLAIAGLSLCGICFIVGCLIWQHWLSQDSAATAIKTTIQSNESEHAVAHALDPILDLARKALAHHIANHQDYTANLTKRERIGKKVYPASTMAMKLRYRPAEASDGRLVSVYLKTTAPKAQIGREVLWNQGANDNKLRAHEGGVLGLVSVDLPPLSRLAMAGNRYPITEIGIERLLKKLIERGERERQMGPATVRVTERVIVGDISCKLLEIIHEESSIEINGNLVPYEFNLAQIYIDESRLVPLKYASYTWPKLPDGEPELLEEYIYEDLQLNVGLTASDFESTNPNYKF